MTSAFEELASDIMVKTERKMVRVLAAKFALTHIPSRSWISTSPTQNMLLIQCVKLPNPSEMLGSMRYPLEGRLPVSVTFA